MNLQPNVPGTVANWSFQNTLADSSGNGLDLSSLDGNTFHTAGGVVQYGAIGDLFGFKFDGSTKLWAPLTSLLLITGDMTVSFFMFQPATFSQTYFCAADPAGRSGGASPDRIGSVYSFFWGAPNDPYYRNYNTGSGVPTSLYGQFAPGSAAWGVGAVHYYTFRRMGTAASVFVDGIRQAPDVVDIQPNVAAGNERFYLGGCEGVSVNMGNNTIIGSFRVTTTARTDVQIGRDAFSAMGPAASTDSGIVYDAVAAAQFATALRQEPRR